MDVVGVYFFCSMISMGLQFCMMKTALSPQYQWGDMSIGSYLHTFVKGCGVGLVLPAIGMVLREFLQR